MTSLWSLHSDEISDEISRDGEGCVGVSSRSFPNRPLSSGIRRRPDLLVSFLFLEGSKFFISFINFALTILDLVPHVFSSV